MTVYVDSVILVSDQKNELHDIIVENGIGLSINNNALNLDEINNFFLESNYEQMRARTVEVFNKNFHHKAVANKIFSEIKEKIDHREVRWPWGPYDSLIDGSNYQVKTLNVHPGEKLSLQLHHRRSEHWVVVRGKATVTLGEEEILLNVNESVYIPKETKHSLANNSDELLQIIEVQCGDYLGEDDIVRFEDKYGRKD